MNDSKSSTLFEYKVEPENSTVVSSSLLYKRIEFEPVNDESSSSIQDSMEPTMEQLADVERQASRLYCVLLSVQYYGYVKPPYDEDYLTTD